MKEFFRDVFIHFALGLRLGLRSRGAAWLLFFGLVCLGASWLGASFSLRQTTVVALDLGLSSLRLVGALLAIAWIQELFVLDVERKLIVVPFVWATSRTEYILGRFFSVIVLLLLALSLGAGVLLAMVSVADWGYAASSPVYMDGRLVLVLAGFLLEAILIAAFALLLASFVSTPSVVLFGGLAFIWAGRIIGPMLDYLTFSPEADDQIKLVHLPLLFAIRWILPELSRLDWRDAVLYGNTMGFDIYMGNLAMVSGYVVFWLLAAMFLINKREIT